MSLPSLPTREHASLDLCNNILQALISGLNRHSERPFWRLKVAAATVLLGLLTSFPVYKTMRSRVASDLVLQAICIQMSHPFSPLPADLKDNRLHPGDGSHIEKLEPRLTIPILGRIGHTGRWTIVIWDYLSAFGVFYLLATLAVTALNDNLSGGLFVLGLGPTFFGSWYFNDVRFGDMVAFFFLLLSVRTRLFALTFCSFLLAAFCDERCVTAIPLLCLYLFVSSSKDIPLRRFVKECSPIFLAALLWCILRVWLARTYHLTIGTTNIATKDIVRENLTDNFPYVFLNIFKASWTLPAIAALGLAFLRRWYMLFVFCASFAIAFAPALLVFDFQRSTSYTFIVLLISLYFFQGDRDTLRKWLATILLINTVLISPWKSILRVLV